jgi:hypothetical protein
MFTMREIQHLPWYERERLNEEAWQAVRRHPRFRLMLVWLPLLSCLATFLTFVLDNILILKLSPLIVAAITLAYLVQGVTGLVWQRRHLREALKLVASNHLRRIDAMGKD